MTNPDGTRLSSPGFSRSEVEAAIERLRRDLFGPTVTTASPK